jgi:hypothetical protein
MRHADDVIGFGDHVPEFILNVPFPDGTGAVGFDPGETLTEALGED